MKTTMQVGGPREAFVNAFRRALIGPVCWALRKVGHPWGGPIADDLFICMKCGDLVGDPAHHRIHKHAFCFRCGLPGARIVDHEIVCASYPRCVGDVP